MLHLPISVQCRSQGPAHWGPLVLPLGRRSVRPPLSGRSHGKRSAAIMGPAVVGEPLECCSNSSNNVLAALGRLPISVITALPYGRAHDSPLLTALQNGSRHPGEGNRCPTIAKTGGDDSVGSRDRSPQAHHRTSSKPWLRRHPIRRAAPSLIR